MLVQANITEFMALGKHASARGSARRGSDPEYALARAVPGGDVPIGLLYLVQRVSGGNWDPEVAVRRELGEVSPVGRRRLLLGGVPYAVPRDRGRVGDGVDAFGGDAEVDRLLHVPRAVVVEEGVDTGRRQEADALAQTIAVLDGFDPEPAEELGVRAARSTDDSSASKTGELGGDGADAGDAGGLVPKAALVAC
jgi:hypothetical protein